MEVNKAQIRDRLVEAARKFGQTVEEHAADQIADMKTSALDSIIRASAISFVLGFLLCLTVIK